MSFGIDNWIYKSILRSTDRIYSLDGNILYIHYIPMMCIGMPTQAYSMYKVITPRLAAVHRNEACYQ